MELQRKEWRRFGDGGGVGVVEEEMKTDWGGGGGASAEVCLDTSSEIFF